MPEKALKMLLDSRSEVSEAVWRQLGHSSLSEGSGGVASSCVRVWLDAKSINRLHL